MKKLFKTLFALALVGVLAACGSAAPSTTSSSTSSQQTNNATFTFAIGGDPTATNPITTSDRWGLTYANIIYSPLVRVHGDGSTSNELAKDVSVSEDGLTVTVTLRDDVKWSDGETFDADDVVFTYNQKFNPANGVNTNFMIDGQSITVEKVDQFTVAFKLPSVSAAAVNNIATEVYIIPEHVNKDITDFSVNELPVAPVGTGPYKLVEYKNGEYIRFVANETYYRGKPQIENLVLRIIKSADTTKVALQTGEVDAAVIFPSDIQDLDAEKIAIHGYSENRVGYMGLNTATPELSDVRVRQALLYALNKEEMNIAAYLSPDNFTSPYSILPPGNAFYTEDVEKYETNLEKAKALLNEAGVSNLTLRLGFNSADQPQTLQATLIQEQLLKIGVKVELAGGDSSALFKELRTKGSTAYHLFLGGYIMGSDPDQYKPLFTTDARSNYFQYDGSTTTDLTFAAGATELDVEKRKAIYNQLQRELAEQAIIYPIVDNKRILAVNKRIGNIEAAKLVPIYTLEDFGQLTISQ